jgi:hypothetical protein
MSWPSQTTLKFIGKNTYQPNAEALDRLAIAQRPRRNDAADRLVGPPRRQAIGNQLKELGKWGVGWGNTAHNVNHSGVDFP